MNQEQKNKIAEIITTMAMYYQRPITTEVVRMMVSHLQDLDFEKVCLAYERYCRDPKNRAFPLPAQIRAIIDPEIDIDLRAREIASRIVYSVSKFGWPNPNKAKEYIGEVGWHIIERFGGWQFICENLGVSIDLTIFQAQSRDIAKSSLIYFKHERFDQPINFIENENRYQLLDSQ